SKSKGNVVDPDELTATCGADALRLYEMFVAPPEKEIEWTDAGLEGSARFLGRVWRLVTPFAEVCAAGDIPAVGGLKPGDAERALRRKTHDTIRRVSEDLDPRVHLNTAVSALMELVNDLYGFCERTRIGPFAADPAVPAAGAGPATLAVVREAIEALVLMLSPFTPHLAEELWEALGHAEGVEAAGWPAYDADVARAETLVLPVQVNGKVRARLTVAVDTAEDELRRLALEQPQVEAHTAGKTVARVVVVPGRLVSIVARA
ncbi:MAG: class I tRNA ligase family protein, partial [Acidobacteria bacterium]|nr:class I tRNA ligase family protein [Acidobacteriota bacterium]